jgi:hypothetical protein
MTEDRNYLRMLSDSELVNMGRERDSGDDLVLVLAERLAELLDVEDQLEAAQAEIEEITASRDHWQAEADMLQAQLEAK